MIIIRILLIPFSMIYSAVIFFRNRFFDYGVFRSYKVSKPVISVGNITTGGTGKTPLVILLSDYFLSKGKKVGIISRGYKRSSKEPVLVCDGININDNTKEAGDELIMTANELMKKFKGSFFIAADSDRIRAAEFLINKFDPGVIILDDGFQHRRIRRDLNIVLIDSHNFIHNRFLYNFTLPSGILRESFDNLHRTDLIIQNDKHKGLKVLSALKIFRKEIFLMRYKSEYFIDNKNVILKHKERNAIVFSGIADEESFISMIKAEGIRIKETMKFSDHHNYTEADIEFLIKRHSGDEIFITTEKDFVKIRQFTEFNENYPVYFLKMKAELYTDRDLMFRKLDEIIL